MNKRWIRSLLTSALLICFAPLVSANGAVEQLKQLLQGYHSFSADFQQITLSENGTQAQQTEGSLLLAKPNLFRWHTLDPFPQEIVSDGSSIWIFDPDLEQVTQRSADTQNDSAPALILNGQMEQLQQRYNIEQIDADESSQLFDLRPKTDQYSFSLIRLAFSMGVISELMLEDALGQRTTIVFSKQVANPTITDNSFQFVVPEGADLIVDKPL